MNTEEPQPITEHSPLLPLAPSKPFPCDWVGCPRGFDTAQQLAMHKIRMHTHRFVRSHKTKKAAIESRKEKQRRYNAAMRARYIAQGLTSAGKPRKKPVKAFPRTNSPAYKALKYRESRDRYWALGLNAKGKPLKMQGVALDNLRKAQEKRRAAERRTKHTMKNKHKRIRFVYPLPAEPEEVEAFAPQTGNAAEMEPTPTPKWVHAQLHFCPKCGEQLTKWKRE